MTDLVSRNGRNWSEVGHAVTDDRWRKRDHLWAEVEQECQRQDAKWGEQLNDDLYWLGILTKELGEVATAMIEDRPVSALRGEIIQVAAVAVQMLGALDRRDGGATRAVLASPVSHVRGICMSKGPSPDLVIEEGE